MLPRSARLSTFPGHVGADGAGGGGVDVGGVGGSTGGGSSMSMSGRYVVQDVYFPPPLP